MSLPVQHKPEIIMNYEDSVFTYPHALSKESMNRLKDYALSEPGLHLRGSKNPEMTRASFTTCLVHNHEDEVYQILSPVWDRCLADHPYDLTFIEPYEIKIYYEGDRFGYHHDGYNSVHMDVDRKLNLIIHLSDEQDYDGGRLYVGNHLCPNTKGTAIFFPAHYYHYVTEITRGSRCVLIGHAWGPTTNLGAA